jgi:hypothetical protein
MGPEPIIRIFFKSFLFGIYTYKNKKGVTLIKVTPT